MANINITAKKSKDNYSLKTVKQLKSGISYPKCWLTICLLVSSADNLCKILGPIWILSFWHLYGIPQDSKVNSEKNHDDKKA